MKWRIPAKTFLLGEYVTLAQGPAIVLTTSPYFELSLTNQESLIGIHPESPAGRWWQQEQCPEKGLSWHDPYKGCGGLGASSAQFIGSYLASCTVKNQKFKREDLLKAYFQHSWSGQGLKPSGYDVMAQLQQGCVYINQNDKIIQSMNWPFTDLSLFLIHTGTKLATHHHLQQITLPTQIEQLSKIVNKALQAFECTNSELLVDSINKYHYKLKELDLVAQHSLDLINEFNSYPEVLATKGCGALGADIILVITENANSLAFHNRLIKSSQILLATEENLTQSTNNVTEWKEPHNLTETP